MSVARQLRRIYLPGRATLLILSILFILPITVSAAVDCGGIYTFYRTITNDDTNAEITLLNDSVVWINSTEQIIWCNSNADLFCYNNYTDYSCYIDSEPNDVRSGTFVDEGHGSDYGSAASPELVAWYNLNDTTDSSTSGNGLTNNGAAATSGGKIGGAYDFEVTDGDYMVLDSMPLTSGDSSFSVTAWIKAESLPVEGTIFAQQNQDPTYGDGFFIETTSAGAVAMKTSNTGAYVTTVTTASSTVTAGTWYHIGVRTDGANAYIYVDGDLKATDTMDAWNSVGGFAYIGEWNGSVEANRFDGIIDELKVFSIDIGQNAIVSAYNNTSPDGFSVLGSEQGMGPAPPSLNVTLDLPVDSGTSSSTVEFKFTPGTAPFSGAELFINYSNTSINLPSPVFDGYTDYDTYKAGTGTDNVVISTGAGGSWNDNRVKHPFPLYSGGTYTIYFDGNDGSNVRIGMANSTSWNASFTENPNNPILDLGTGGTWDDNNVESPVIVDDCLGDGDLCMYYFGNDGANSRIGLATSSDGGYTWTKVPYNKCSGVTGNGCIFDLGTGGTWDDYHVHSFAIETNGTSLNMLYTGAATSSATSWNIGLAYTTDGLNWTKYASNPVMSKNTSSQWMCSCVGLSKELIYENSTWHTFFAGKDDSCGESETNEAYTSDIGYAWSTDLINWNIYHNNAVVTNDRAWESWEVENLNMLEVGNKYYGYYNAYAGSPSAIGGIEMDTGATGWGSIATNSSVLVDGVQSTITVDFSGYNLPLTIEWNINLTGGGSSVFATSNYTLSIYDVIGETHTYDSSTYETVEADINLTIGVANANSVEAYLFYDGINESFDSYSNTGNSYYFGAQVIPGLVQTNGTSKNFNWVYTIHYTNGTDSTINSSTESQAIAFAYTQGTPSGNDVLEGNDITINNTVTNHSTAASLSMILWYNDTAYTMTADGLTYTYTIEAGEISGALNSSAPFNTSLNVTFAGVSRVTNTSTTNATVYRLLLTNCSAGSGSITKTLTYYLKDEDTDSAINGTLDINFDVTNGDVARNYSWSFENLADYSICLYPTWATLTTDSTSQYSATGYSPRTYYLNNANLTNVTESVNLYLKTNTSTDFISIQVYNALGLPEEDVYINIARYDIGTNTYTTVAILKTDFDGKAYSYLVKDTVWYRFTLYDDDAAVLDQYDPMIITEDTLTFRLTQGALGEWFDYHGSVAFSCSEVSNTSTCTVTDTSGLMTTSTLTVNKWATLGWLEICDTSSTSSSTTHVCDLGNTDDTLYFYKLSAEFQSTESVLESDYLDYTTDTPQYGELGIVAAIFIILVLVFVGAHRPEIAITLSAVSSVLSWGFGLVEIGYGSVVALMVVSAVAIYKMRSNR